MKYHDKITRLCGWLTPNVDVTINLVNTETDTLIAATDYVCTESNVQPGLYMYDTDKITEDVSKVEVAYIMNAADGDTYGGKIVIDKNERSADTGSWEMVNNQMMMYDAHGELVTTFNLYNAAGQPSMFNVTKRERVE